MTHNQLMAKLEFVTGSPDSKSVPNPSCISSDQTIKGLNLTFYDGNHWGKWYFLYGCFLFSLPFRNLHKTKSSAWVYWKWEIESLNILARNCVYKWEKFNWASMHIIKEKLGYTMRSYCTSQRMICSILWYTIMEKNMKEYIYVCSLTGGSDSKESACSVRDPVQFLGWADPLKKGMATHSSIPAWWIPWTEEAGGLQSRGSQRVRHDWATNTRVYV